MLFQNPRQPHRVAFLLYTFTAQYNIIVWRQLLVITSTYFRAVVFCIEPSEKKVQGLPCRRKDFKNGLIMANINKKIIIISTMYLRKMLCFKYLHKSVLVEYKSKNSLSRLVAPAGIFSGN